MRTQLLFPSIAVTSLAVLFGLTPAASSEAAPPRVAATTPDLGDELVDPGLTELRITFTEDMDTRGGMSLCGGGPTFPRVTAKARWEDARTIVVPIALEPSRRYQLSINCASAQNFRSASGEPAAISPLSFATAPSSAESHPPAPLSPDLNRRAISAVRRAIDERYSHRDVRGVNWEEQIDAHAAALENAGARGEFARALADALSPARDVHLSIQIGAARVGTFSPMQTPNVNLGTLAKLVPEWTVRNNTVTTGLFPPEDGSERPIAYIALNSWPSDLSQIRPALDFLTEQIRAAGVIIDVRTNDGGDERTARRVAACFVDEAAVYSRHVFRDPMSPDGWTQPSERRIERAREAPRYAGPVAVLIGPACMSSNESFILMLKTTPRTTLIGETTFGASGNARPVDLGNGVTLFVPSWKDMLPDGTPLEGRGITPDVHVRTSPSELQNSDPVLETALKHLRSGAR